MQQKKNTANQIVEPLSRNRNKATKEHRGLQQLDDARTGSVTKLGLRNHRGRCDKTGSQTGLGTGSQIGLNKSIFNPIKVVHIATVTPNHEPNSLIPC